MSVIQISTAVLIGTKEISVSIMVSAFQALPLSQPSVINETCLREQIDFKSVVESWPVGMILTYLRINASKELLPRTLLPLQRYPVALESIFLLESLKSPPLKT